MTEAEKPIEAPKAEETEKTKPPFFRILREGIENPRLQLPIYNDSGIFTEKIMLRTDESDKQGNSYDMLEYDAIDNDSDLPESCYENTLLGYMLFILPKHREPFLKYQASKCENPLQWLEELAEFWEAYHAEIVKRSDERLFVTYSELIKSVTEIYKKKKDKTYMDFNWLCEPTKLIEVALALECAKMVEYPTGKRLETQNKYIESFLHALNVDVPITTIETLKKNILRKSSVENTCLQDMYTKLDEALKIVAK